ncbi:lysylphosphatidylglycerol synthase transmembrane domain-containing protein [Rhizobium alvei]|uniref:Lysylphosphatidylglycerol synthase transmembrane domain-containing protein n=1 Tax=Rhizobium alvei TaxID=1132659 RepID=A0ABT8YH26_9HYPH|nr:lysylphosphatidylglycerol synthase transmembrane domain-containing protein [Rhizobium alvei]MDO6962982.1 lysylphosphatidylglycerol synthase transmembrane domain-containing protein [Rhizobium alvei]
MSASTNTEPGPGGQGSTPLLDPVSGAPIDGTLPKTSSRQLLVGWGLALLAVAAVASLFLHVGDLRLFAEHLRSANPLWIAAAFLCQALTYLCAALVWRGTLDKAGEPQPLASLFNLALLELFANQALPTGGLSGSILVVHGLVRRGADAAIATTALLVAYISYYAAYLLVGLAAFFLLWHLGDLEGPWLVLLWLFLGVVILLALGLLAIAFDRGRFVPRAVLGWSPIARFVRILARVRTELLVDRSVLGQAIVWQAAIFLLDAATLWCAAEAVGGDGPLSILLPATFIAFMLASITATLTPVPMGLGTFEGVAAAMLHFLGMGLEAALAATLIFRGLTLWLPMLPGLILMRRETRG